MKKGNDNNAFTPYAGTPCFPTSKDRNTEAGKEPRLPSEINQESVLSAFAECFGAG